MRTWTALGLGSIVAIAAAIALIAWGLSNTRGVVQPISYWTIDPRTIGVVVLHGRPGNPCAITLVTETSDTVQVRAECQEHWLSTGSTGALYRYEFIVTLDADLGDRVVKDGSGHDAERCGSEGCP